MPDNAPILSVRNLSKRFGGLHAVESVSFDLMNGEILGLLGPNGAGKTTCFNMISGVYTPTEGTIHFRGRRTDGLEPHEMAALGVGRTFQIVRPFAAMTVAENVMTALGRSNYTGLHALVRAWNTRAARLRAVVEKPRLADAPSRLGIVGRYILSETIFEHIDQIPPGKDGELQITDALASQIASGETVWSYQFEGTRYDTGRPLGYIVANVAAALQREDLAAPLSARLNTLLAGGR